jgi:hypothetical protein
MTGHPNLLSSAPAASALHKSCSPAGKANVMGSEVDGSTDFSNFNGIYSEN